MSYEPDEQAEAQAEFDAWLEELSDPKHWIVLQRALNDLGIAYELKPEGGLDLLIHDPDDLEEDDGFQEVMHNRYLEMYIDEILAGLANKGLIESSVDENGGLVYGATE